MKIENTRAKIHHIGDEITLLPGSNDVDAAEWAKVKDLALVRHHIEAGHLKVISEPKAAK